MFAVCSTERMFVPAHDRIILLAAIAHHQTNTIVLGERCSAVSRNRSFLAILRHPFRCRTLFIIYRQR